MELRQDAVAGREADLQVGAAGRLVAVALGAHIQVREDRGLLLQGEHGAGLQVVLRG
ncbi:hypothetical protein [Bordetella pertussis]|uniref:hypothetical protein n=1 Tax=Bordetella pertussis TaxID=520 RepID=UPI001F2F2122|nr:hypothetical protein [Bordetella pertussis]